MTRRLIIIVSVGLATVAAPIATPAFAALPNFEQNAVFLGNANATTLESTGGTRVECENSSIAGQAEKATKHVSKVKLILRGCKSGAECKSAGAAKEEIKSEELEGDIGYIEPAVAGAKTIVMAVKPKAGVIASYVCGTVLLEDIGCVIGELSPANKLSEAFTLEFSLAAVGVEKYLSYEFEKGLKRGCELAVIYEGDLEDEEGDALQAIHDVQVPCPGMKVNS